MEKNYCTNCQYLSQDINQKLISGWSSMLYDSHNTANTCFILLKIFMGIKKELYHLAKKNSKQLHYF